MAYDADLVARIREHVGAGIGISEQRMFGGLAFLVNGIMAVAASGSGGILVRVDPAEYEQLLASPSVEAAVMGTRRMRGWVRVATDDLDDSALAMWVQRGLDYAGSLPAKLSEA